MSHRVRLASEADVSDIKALADRHRGELGFNPRQRFLDSVHKGELLVALEAERVVGFARFHHRRDSSTTIYEIASDIHSRGIGRQLVEALRARCLEQGSRRIKLLCPVELPANDFYQALGFQRVGERSREGRKRPLYEWELPVLPPRPLRFVASLTTTTHDVKTLVRLWEAEGHSERPFDECIVTALFASPGTLKWIRHMHDHWGVQVVFDSGGFFVQQGKIAYDELFARLLQFYEQNDWASAYVLPDFVPTSRQSADEVSERVHVTASEGVKFYRRMPVELRERALGVMQGHTPEHLRLCFRAFGEAGISRIGFGSFDTGGTNSEINLLTEDSLSRLRFVRRMLLDHHKQSAGGRVPDLHLFGVSSPSMVERFPDYLATSFDSSGWIMTAGLGNVYLPFQGRRNVSHRSSSLQMGPGLSASEFYASCERTGHSCPFCSDYKKLQSDRFARMCHNVVVFSEMTAQVNARRAKTLANSSSCVPA
jgi:N-acetylglutamate synthase-like GNAT family acetyltransferase